MYDVFVEGMFLPVMCRSGRGRGSNPWVESHRIWVNSRAVGIFGLSFPICATSWRDMRIAAAGLLV